jgi:methyl-accepting chemotaxis protein
MSPLGKIKEIYSDEDYKIQQKAPVLAVLSLMVSILIIPVILLNLINHEALIRILLDIFMGLTVFSSFLLVLKKRYNLASIIFLAGIIVTLSAIFISLSFKTNQIIHSNGLSLLEFMIMATLFSNSKNQTLFFTTTAFVAFLVSSLIALLTGHVHTEIMNPLVQFIFPTILLFTAAISFYLLKKIEDNIFYDIKKKLHLSRIDEIKKKDLIMSSAKQLEKSHEVSQLADKVIRTSSAVKNSLESVMDQVNMLQNSFNSSSEALDHINTSVDRLKGLSDDQASNVTESSASIEEMTASIVNVSTIIDKKKETVSTLKEISSRGEETLENTIESFEMVIKHLDSIKEMTSIIDSIATQTNLLSMNAAIESAHAGDAGKGFAVVADEIRKLAESSSLNAGEIAQTLNSLIVAIEKAGIEINESGSSFKKMHQQIEEVSQAMNEISANSNELSIGSKEVLETSSNLNILTQDVSVSVNEVRNNQQVVCSDINDVLGSADTVLRSVSDMMKNIGEISEEVVEIKQSVDLLIEHSRMLNQEIES